MADVNELEQGKGMHSSSRSSPQRSPWTLHTDREHSLIFTQDQIILVAGRISDWAPLKTGIDFKPSLIDRCADGSPWTLPASRTLPGLKAAQCCYRWIDCWNSLFRLSQVFLSRPMTHWSSFRPCYRGHVLPPPYVSFSDTWFYHDFPVSLQMKSTKSSSLSTLHMEQCPDLSFFLSLLCGYTQCVPASLKVWLSLSKRFSIESWTWKICTDDSCQGIQVQTFHCLAASKSLVSKRTVLKIFICLFSCIFPTIPQGLERTWPLTTWGLGPHSLDHSWDTFTKLCLIFCYFLEE